MYTIEQASTYHITYGTREEAVKAIKDSLNSTTGRTYYLQEIIEAYKAEDKPVVVISVKEALEQVSNHSKNKKECISWD